ncbi:unnamed protein product [Diatraea saccharalis]|uniref:EGF-like domain-containing protein n=1 Tax=Diatraea saccharalis TaxID=40085 RepID=A0A9N9RF14_9NEOP|nr:unnamed protein product [Diatraea saccharalis]
MELKTVFIFFVVVFLEVVLCGEDELREGDTAVCTEIVSQLQSIKKTYGCGKRKKCTRVERKWVPTKKNICCDGYKFYKGKCILDVVCEEPCVNAQCTGFNNCTCDPGLVHINETHCGPACSDGYYNDFSTVTLDCISKCHQPCINGTCTDFDQCTCNTGYKLKIGSKFQCEPECVNCESGVCVAPNKCDCNKGYAKNDSDICVPVCNDPCENGYCFAPDQCKCNSGYSYDEVLKSCIAVCKETCVNSSCISPDKCECWSGYISINNRASCVPYCSTCANGDCIAPNLCRCKEGYERHNNTCELIPLRNCKGCEPTCNESICACANGALCVLSTEEAIVASSPTLAGLQLTWMLGGALGILLLVFVLVIIQRTWRQRKQFEQKANGDDYRTCDSIMHTIPNSLIRQKYDDEENDGDYDEVEHRQTNLDLLSPHEYVEKM